MSMQYITDTFQAHVDNKRLAGAEYAVFENGKRIGYGVCGYKDAAQTIALKGNEVYRLASMTKPITAVAVLILKERGLLSLDAPVSAYIPNFNHACVGKMENGKPVFASPAKEITVRNLLSHCSGLSSCGEVGNYQAEQFGEPKDLEENVLKWKGAFLDFAPESAQNYSPFVAFDTAALIVQKVSGMPFFEFLKKEIFDPLDMVDTAFELSDDLYDRLVQMNVSDANGGLIGEEYGRRGFTVFAEGYTGGSAGLVSTLEDYSHFALMLSNKGTYNGKRIISEESVKEMSMPQLDQDKIAGVSSYFNWGLGVRVVEDSCEWQPLPAGSFGWSGAYGTHFWIEPKTGIAAVLMLNKNDVGGSGSPYSLEFERLVQAR